MKKYIIIPILLSLFIFVGCVEDLPTTSMVEIEPGSTYLSLRSTEITVPVAGGVPESITLKSLRILVFKKASGQIVTNKKFDITSVNATEQEDGSWIADFSEFVAPTNPGLSVVYAVLNEDVSQVSGQSLTTELDGITTLDGMQALVNTPLTYTPLRVVIDEDTGKPIEPPFVMVAYDEFTIPDNRPITDPFTADLRGLGEDSKGFAMDRTMAKVTIKGVSNNNTDGSPLSEALQLETSSIFILEMGLTNVPKQYFWTPNKQQITYTNPVPPYNPALGYQNITFPLPENSDLDYYDRNWDGNIRFEFTANVIETQTKDARIWWTGKAMGSGAYTLNKYEIDAKIINDNNKQSNLYYDIYNGTNPPILELNSGNWPSWALDKLNDPSLPFNPSEYVFKDQNFEPQITGGSWSLKEKNISYYVPEHILSASSDATNSTQLRVKAAKVSLPTTISAEESSSIVWNNPTWGPWSYAVIAGQSITQALLNTLWGFERDTLTINNVRHPIIRHYWNLGLRVREGTNTGTIEGVQFKNISATPETNIKTFYIPIRNNVDEGNTADYNIYRNHEYKFSVHVLEQWPLSAPSGAPSQASTRSAWEDPNQSMVLRIVPE